MAAGRCSELLGPCMNPTWTELAGTGAEAAQAAEGKAQGAEARAGAAQGEPEDKDVSGVLSGGRQVAAGRHCELLGPGVKGGAEKVGVAKASGTEDAFGATANTCFLPKNAHCLLLELTREGPPTALGVVRCTESLRLPE